MKHFINTIILVVVGVQVGRAQTVRDSSGVQIVESQSPSWSDGQAWTVSGEPSLSLGVVDGDPRYLFSEVEGVVLLTDGRLAVADRGSHEVRVFTEDGVFDTSVGGEGEGPGEFGWLSWIGECKAGVLEAYDPMLNRITTIRLDDLTLDTRILQSGAAGGGRAPDQVRCSNGGLLALSHSLGIPPGDPGPVRWPVSLEFFGEASEPPQFVTEAPGDDRYFDRGDLGPRPLGRRTVFATSGDLIALGTQDESEVAILDAHGELRQIWRWRDATLEVTPDDVASYIDGLLASAGSEAAARRIRAAFLEHDFPDRLPAYGGILFDRTGNLWVAETVRPGGTENRWRVFSRTGTLLGLISLPQSFAPMSITGERVAGLWRSDLDVEYVWVLEIRKPGRSYGTVGQWADLDNHAAILTEIVLAVRNEDGGALGVR